MSVPYARWTIPQIFDEHWGDTFFYIAHFFERKRWSRRSALLDEDVRR